MSDTSGNEDTHDPLGPFDAFRARRAEEQAANELFPEEYAADQYGAEPYMPEHYESVPSSYAQPLPEGVAVPGGGHGHGKVRSVAVLAGAVVLVAGVVGGVYAATRSSGSPVASSGVTASASPSAGAAKGAKIGTAKAVTARLTVTSVSGDSFNATTANGRTLSVQITPDTKFGTVARPFTRSQLVTGAVIFARLRRDANGGVVATVIASSTADKGAKAPAVAPSQAGA